MTNTRWDRPALDGLLGMAAADALGVPYEFRSRWEMLEDPCTDMVGYGTYNQPEGSWSDDTSMALCAADSLAKGFDPDDMMKKFAAWMTKAHYTATGVRFDIGMTCRRAIGNYVNGLEPDLCGDCSEYGNGNGALMRIYPDALCQSLSADRDNASIESFLAPIHASARLTHGHERGLICCGSYALMLDAWLHRREEETLLSVFSHAFDRAKDAYTAMGGAFAREMNKPGLFIHPMDLIDYEIDMLASSGYVIHTLHAAVYCLLKTENFRDCALMAVNMGEDTDTTAAVAGALAGVIYGRGGIPQDWLKKLKNKELIEKIADKLDKKLLGQEETERTEIDSFTGEYAHMALKAAARIELDGVVYGNAHAAFLAQAAPESDRVQFAPLSAHQARRLHKQLPLRDDWEENREYALTLVCRAKYGQNPELRKKLLATGSLPIVYDTTGAHDNEMGRCACEACAGKEAKNLYGRTLMRVRDELRS